MPNIIDKVNINGTSYDIKDSISPASTITSSDIENWNNKVDSHSEYNNEAAEILNEDGVINIGASGSNHTLGIHLDSELFSIHDPSAEITYIHIYPYSDGSDEFVHITSVKAPVYPTDAANKQYVDNSIAAIDIPTVPSNVSAFNNDAGYISSVTSADISNALGYTPTSNTGTVTSVALSNGGGLSINGSPITTSGTITIGHSNSVTAQTTQAIYPIKIDAQGHVSAYGTAVSIPSTAADINAVATSAVGASSGVAPLNASGKIDSTYLPSYVDDVIEGYYYNNKFYKESTHTTEITGETGKIYIDLSTDKVYRYGGTAYAEIAQGSLVSVTRDLNSGTQIGTITINGTGTSLYAPTPPSKVSELSNDSGFITGISAADVSTALGYTPYNATNPNGYVNAAGASAAAPVQSVNSKTGAVTLSASDVGALPSNTTIPTVTNTYSSSGTDAVSGTAVYSALQTLDSSITATANSAISAITITDGKITASSKIAIPTVPNNVSAFSNDAGYITGIDSSDVTTALGYTPISAETDPIFSASAAAGISAADISSWNSKVSDDHKWNDVALDKSYFDDDGDYSVPVLLSNSATSAKLLKIYQAVIARSIPRRDANGYLYATTPSSADSSTKVATTAFVKTVLPTVPTNVSSFSNDAGYITLADLPIYDGTVEINARGQSF